MGGTTATTALPTPSQPTIPPPPLPPPAATDATDANWVLPSFEHPTPPACVPTDSLTLEVTPRPPSGFPIPQLGDSMTRRLDPLLRTAWAGKPDPKAWVRAWRAKFEPDAEATYSKLKNLIHKVVGRDAATSLVISTPQEDDSFTLERYPPPWHFLISGLSQSAMDFLVSMQVISTAELTVFILPFIQPVPTYLCTLENFTLPDSPESNTTVAGIVKRALSSHDVFTEYVRSEDPNPDTLATVINSIYVTSLRIATTTSRKQTLWNVYCSRPPSFLNIDKYFIWQCLIRTARFRSEDYGMGAVRVGDKQFKCLGCKSLDHPTGLCPFPSLPGWMGPKPQITDSIMPQSGSSSKIPKNRHPVRGGRGTPRGRGSRGGPRF